MSEIDDIFDEHKKRMNAIVDTFAADITADVHRAINRLKFWCGVVFAVSLTLLVIIACLR